MFASAPAAQALERGQRLGIEAVAEVARRAVGVGRRHELAEEGLRRELPHLLAGRPAHGGVGRDDGDLLERAVLGREALVQRVRVLGIAHLERPVDGVGAVAVEDEDAAGALRGDPARERSEEHTSELQSRRDLVCRLLLEKKKENIVERPRGTCSHRPYPETHPSRTPTSAAYERAKESLQLFIGFPCWPAT